MYSMRWHERVIAELRGLPPRAWLTCSRDSGIDYAIDRIHTIDYPEIVLSIDRESSEIPMGELFSRAIANGTGNSLLTEESSVEQGIKLLLDYQEAIGPVNVVICWANKNRDLVKHIVGALLPGSRLLVIDEVGVDGDPLLGFTSVPVDFLKLSFDEAVCEAKDALTDSEVGHLLQETEGFFARYKLALLSKLGLPTTLAHSARQRTWGEGTNLEGVLAALAENGLWPDVLEVACKNESSLISNYIDDIGNYFFNKGAFTYFWSRLNRLPAEIKRSERVAYWLVSVANATKRRKQVAGYAKEVMGLCDAPEVIATTAVASPTESMLSETRRAVEIRRTPATLRAYGFALAWAGDRGQPVALFREALAMAEAEDAGHLVVACATDIAEVELRLGNYKSASEWSLWALSEHSRRGLTEQLRFKSAAAIHSFAQVLRGDVIAASATMNGVDVDASYLEVPGFEAVLSARADLEFLSGRLPEAERLYRVIHQNAPIEVFCISGLGLLGCLLASGKAGEASRLAETAYAVSRSSSEYEQALSELMLGMAQGDVEPVVAERRLSAAVEGLQNTISDLQVAQAAIWLAMLRLREGRRRDAVAALRLGASGLQELGKSGWQLMSGNHKLMPQIQKLWSDSEFEFEFKFLGGRILETPVIKKELGLRSAEILTILSVYGEGLTGERLHTYLYGESAYSTSAMKATISRLRELVPIASSPYRIDATYRADFMNVLDLIGNGEIQRALNAYTGPLMPESDSPLVCEWRDHVDEAIRSAVLELCDPDNLIQLATILDGDLEVWEKAKESVAANDYRRPVINARIRRIKSTWDT